MPNPIKKTERDALKRALPEILKLTRNKRREVDADKFLLLFWDEQTVAMVNTVRGLVSRGQLDARIQTMEITCKVQHPLYPERHIGFLFNIAEPRTNIALLWPKDMELRADYDIELWGNIQDMAQEIVDEAIERGTFKEVCEFLFENCATHEAAYRLFPGYLTILRTAGYGEYVREVEGATRTPQLPAMPQHMRSKVRYVNHWWAMQQLLGTFDGSAPRQARTDGTVEVTLGGSGTRRFYEAGEDEIVMHYEA